MIVFKNSTTSLPILNLGMHEYRTGEAVTINSHKIFLFISISQEELV